MSQNGPSQGSRMGLIIGLAALAGGGWLLLNSMEVGVPAFKDLWPILLILAGLGFLTDYFFLSKQPGSAGLAVGWIGFGVLAFALTLDYTNWRKALDWLPSFPTILGLSFLTTWLAGKMRSSNLVIASGVLLGLGLMGFAARFDFLKRILPSAQVFWAVLLVVGGVYLVWRTASRPRQ